MSDLIELFPRAKPWQPPGTETRRLLNYYDMPLTGVISQQGQSYLFHCIAGSLDDINLWKYVCLSGTDEQELLALEGAALDAVVDRVVDLDGVVAFADDHGISAWVEDGPDLVERLVEQMQAERARLKRDTEDVTSLV